VRVKIQDCLKKGRRPAPGRVMINRALEKLIGLPGQRSWRNFWAYVIDTDTRRYIAISKHAVNIPLDGGVKCAAYGDHLFVLDDGGKEQTLKLVKLMPLSHQSRADLKPQPSPESPSQAGPEPTILRGSSSNKSPESPEAMAPAADAVNEPQESTAKAQLTIDCVPGPGSVTMGGKPVGLTPVSASLDSGVIALVIQKTGFVEWAAQVELIAGSTVTLNGLRRAVRSRSG
jgi:hypothetical protein